MYDDYNHICALSTQLFECIETFESEDQIRSAIVQLINMKEWFYDNQVNIVLNQIAERASQYPEELNTPALNDFIINTVDRMDSIHYFQQHEFFHKVLELQRPGLNNFSDICDLVEDSDEIWPEPRSVFLQHMRGYNPR